MKKIIALIFAISPLSVLAAPITNVNDVANRATEIGQLVIQLAIAIAVVWIIVSVVRYLIAGADSTARKEGGVRILWGVVGLFVILSIWGLVFILTESFSTQNRAPTEEIQRASTLPRINRVNLNGGTDNGPGNVYSNNPGGASCTGSTCGPGAYAEPNYIDSFGNSHPPLR